MSKKEWKVVVDDERCGFKIEEFERVLCNHVDSPSDEGNPDCLCDCEEKVCPLRVELMNWHSLKYGPAFNLDSSENNYYHQKKKVEK